MIVYIALGIGIAAIVAIVFLFISLFRKAAGSIERWDDD